MRASWWQAIGVVVVCSAILGGCAFSAEQPSQESKVTLEEAKADAQAMELEIASLIPTDMLVNVDQKPTGVLLSCDETKHQWAGGSTVSLAPDTDVENLVKKMEARIAEDDRFDSRSWLGPTGGYNVQLMSTTSAEGYIFSEGEPGTVDINSFSECFTLPEGVYPGGKF